MLLFVICFTLNSSVTGIDFSLLKKRVYLCNFKELRDFGTYRNNNIVEKDLRAHRVDFAAFSRAIRN